ncbi:MAG TPA: choice-of-anchor Q domain-containing protein, partial [Marinilabiliaceae bacterium]|nr:choice-of-anchor Q domain-containing protein [Marinilabiliaceae bacterium]
LFADPANGNYRLLVNSPAINKGSVTAIPTGLTNDFDGLARQMGTAPDMGMYEGAFVTNFEPSNNGVAKPSMFFGTNLMWGYTTESIGTMQAGTQFAVQVWENGKPETLVVDAQPWQTATVTTGSIQFNKTYQWKVGVVINNHTYWSNAATFYVGRENPIHVKPGGTGNGDSWSAALGSLTDALNLATPGDRIWVSAGTYKPTTGTDRNISFKLKSNVEVLGGFIDGGTISSRNPAKNVTILSGDIGATGVDTDNSYHVIYNNYTSSTPLENAVLDGFIITGGNAGTFNGGGMLNEYASPTIRYCKFYDNKATNGGAISNNNSSPRISNSLFYSNSATNWGGAIYADNVSLPIVINCTITENNAEESAGGYYGTGTIGNSILYGNTSSYYYYKQIYNSHTLTISNSCIEGGYVGKDNVSGNPHFVDITSRNYRIGSFSSCYEKGNNALLISEETFYDLSFGEARILGTVDIGAYEMQASVSAGSIEITQITPSDNAAQVDIATPIVITFNQPIFVNSSLITLSGNSIKRQRMSNDRMTLTLEMSDPWEFNQSYTVTFTEGAFTHINNDLFTNVNSSISFTVRDCVNGAIQLTASQAEPCPYTNVTLEATVTGDVNNDYSWKFNNALLDSLDGKTSYEIDRVSNSNVGVYSFSVSDMCGSSISSIFNLQLKAGLNKPVIKKKWDDVYLVDNSSNLFSNYVWEYGGWKITDPKQYVFISSNSIGKLVVKATDAESGCTVVSDTLNLALQAISKSLSVSPNPVKQSNTVNISFVGGNQSGTIQLFDSKGVLISTAKFEDVNSYPFDKTNLSPGLYLLEIVGNQTQSIVKLIIE